MADTIESLRKELDELRKKTDDAKKGINDIADSSGRIKILADSFNATRNSIEDTNKVAGTLLQNFANTNNIKLDGAMGAFSGLTKAILGSGDSTNAYASVVKSLGGTLNNVLGPELARVFTTLASMPSMFDALTGTTREFKKDTIDLGSVYGLTFEQISRKTIDYQNAVLFANNYTFEGIDAVRKAAAATAQYGISIDELTRNFNVAGHEQSFLSEGFLIASDTGLESNRVFNMMAQASRTMGYSIEDATKPLIALENISRATGLPITQIGEKVFSTAQQFARLGLTVDSMEPIIRRFADNLGPAFKGLAVDEVTRLMKNLESQINTTQAAFVAMRGGLASPGSGVAEAQLAFEDAFKNPVEIMKSLATTLGGVAGGRIIKFEEARANPELANQFKIQRDLLAQLTGNTDPQSQRTLMAILSDLQSGRALTASQDKTLQDSLKSGQQKQDERASMQEQLSRITVGLQTQNNILLGNVLNRLLPSQVQGELARKTGIVAAESVEAFIKSADKIGAGVAEFAKGKGFDMGGVGDKISNAISTQLPGRELSETPRFTVGVNPFAERTLTGVPPASKPEAGLPAPPIPTPTTTTGESSKTTVAPGTKASEQMIITFRGEGELMQALAKAATAIHNKTLHGSG